MFYRILCAVCCFTPITLLAQDTLKLTAGAELKLTGAVVITLENMHLDNDGLIAQAAGDGSFYFSGNNTTRLLGNTLPSFDVLEIAKTAGAQLTLQRNISVVSAINLNSGYLNLNNNNILLQPAALVYGESETSRITGTNGGFVEITRTLNAPVLVNPGNLGAIFTSSQNLGSTVIRRGHTAQPIGTGNSVNRYFDILPTNNTGLNATLRFQYLDAELNGLDEHSLSLWENAGNNTWSSIGFDNRNTTANYVEKTGLSGFSEWTLNVPAGSLPVKFISFNAICENEKISLVWKTAEEVNSSRFDIERTSNGVNWIIIGQVTASGYSQSEKTYTYNDAGPLFSGTMYRIVEYDLDGRRQYSGIVSAFCDRKESIRVWPNPVEDIVRLNIYSNSQSQILLQVYDSKGALVLMQKDNLVQGSNQLTVPVQKLARGIYQLKATYQKGITKTFRLVKLNQ